MAAKKVIKPNVPMKQMNWTKVANHKVGDTLWKNINDEEVKINVSELEDLFQKKGAPGWTYYFQEERKKGNASIVALHSRTGKASWRSRARRACCWCAGCG